MLDFSSLTQLAKEAALDAGEFLKKGFGTKFDVELKSGAQDFVTIYDRQAEEKIINKIRKKYPEHAFLGEEGGYQGEANEVLWIIDPLDGTTNFVRNIPLFAVCIAAAYKNELVAACIFMPMTNELFHAEKGKGAFLNGSPIHVSKTKDMKDSVLVTGFPYHWQEAKVHCIDAFNEFIQMGVPMRDLGSAAIDLCYVAKGSFDGYFMPFQKPWDWAAGKLIVEEAGGKVTQYSGKSHTSFEVLSLVATNTHLHDTFLKLLAK